MCPTGPASTEHRSGEILLRTYMRVGGFVTMVFGLAVTAACSSPVAGITAAPAVGANASSASTTAPSSITTGSTSTRSSSSTSAEVTTSSAAAAASDQAAFGETYKWVDGLEVTVSAGTPFTPSDYVVADSPATAYLSYTVTIVNKTGATYEPALFSTSVQSGDKEGDQIFDSANGYTGTPSTSILDGRQSSFTVGFGVSNPADVVMEIRPGFDYKKAFFTS